MSYIGSTPTTQSFIAGTDSFNGTGSQTDFTLSRFVNSVNDVQVVVNNVVQYPPNYSVSGNTLTISPAPSAGTNNVYVRYLSTTLQSIAVTGGSTVNGTFGVSANSSLDAFRITQVGTGNALVVEDDTNPDATPLIVDSAGRLVVGYTSATPATLPNTKNIQSHSTGGPAGYTAVRWDDGANGPQLLFGKSRGGAVGTLGIVSDGDILGQLYFSGDDGTDLVTPGAQIIAKVDGTPGVNDMPGRLEFYTTADGNSVSTERMRIDSAGNVGIRTAGPLADLQIGDGASAALGSTAPYAWVSARANSVSNIPTTPQELLKLSWQEGTQDISSGEGCAINFAVSLAGDSGTFYNVAQIASFKESTSDSSGTGRLSSLIFSTSDDGAAAPTERMRINSSGTLLVGRTSGLGSGRFVVESNAATVNPAVISNTNSGSSGDYSIIFYRNGSIVGSVQTTLSATQFVTSSDYRLKHDIQPMTGALAKVAQLKPVTYKWNADNSESQGFIAHELQAVVPDCVTGEKDAVDSEGNPVYQGIDTSFLVATLTAAIQEQQAMIDTMKQEIAELKAKVGE